MVGSRLDRRLHRVCDRADLGALKCDEPALGLVQVRVWVSVGQRGDRS